MLEPLRLDHNKLWKIMKEMGILDHLTCPLWNMFPSQEATVRTGHGKMDWFQIGKGVHQGCIFSPCLFNLHAEYIMWNAQLDEAQAEIKIAGRNINNFPYADDTTLMAGSHLLFKDGDWSLEIKWCLLLGRKAMTNLDSLLNSRDITLLTWVHLVNAMVFPVVMYGCKRWTIKKAECWRIDVFEL